MIKEKLAKKEIVIEPASPKECEMIEKRAREFYENPESFVPWETVLKRLQELR